MTFLAATHKWSFDVKNVIFVYVNLRLYSVLPSEVLPLPIEIHLTLRTAWGSADAQTRTQGFTPTELSHCSITVGFYVEQRHSSGRRLPVIQRCLYFKGRFKISLQ